MTHATRGPAGNDPGWPDRGWITLRFAVPILPLATTYLFRRRDPTRGKHGAMHGLLVMRRLYVDYLASLFAIGVIAALLAPGWGRDSGDDVLAWVLLAAATLLATLATRRWADRPLDPDSLTDSFRVRFFLRVAFAQSVALMGFVCFILTGGWWFYPLGLALAARGLHFAAPSRAQLAADEARLSNQGHAVSIAATFAPSS